ncbi:MAG: serine hydrolase [Acidobacteria bacterium]|nr:serine hydrolase [Acidobacteriota bacterium]
MHSQIPILSGSVSTLVLICVIGLAGCVDTPQPSLGLDAGIVAAIDDVISDYFPSQSAPGVAVLITRDGERVYERAIGRANLEVNADIGTDSVFRIGSNTKPFTAAAVPKLVDEGRLSFQDEIGAHLPDYPSHDRSITIKHLLTHTSGISDFTSIDGFYPRQFVDQSPEDFIEFFKDEPLQFEPGSQYRYSNSGYFLLGHIVATVTGMPYSTYLDETFFAPLGMDNTFYDSSRRIVENRASGYVPEGDGFLNGKYISNSIPYAAGSLISTVEDLATWYDAVMSGRIVDQALVEQATSPYRLEDGSLSCCGYAWFLGDLAGSPVIGHTGGITGFYSTLVYLPRERVFAAALTNANWQHFDFENLAPKLAALAIGKPYFPPIAPAPDVSAAAGIYRSTSGTAIEIRSKNGALYFVGNNDSEWPLYSTAENQFYNEVEFTTFEFSASENVSFGVLAAKRHGEPIVYVRE